MNILKQNILFLALGAAGLCACSSTDSLEGQGGPAQGGGPAKIAFSLGDKGTRAASGTVWQTAEEKDIYNLYAVVFKDASQTLTTTIQLDKEDNASDTFLQCIEIYNDATTPMPTTDQKIITVAEGGDAHVVFVANAGETLRQSLTGQGGTPLTATSTVADFKALTEQDRQLSDGGCYPMLMTSEHFYSMELDEALDQNLGTVYMQRAAARIDVVNKTKDYTVTAVALKNRTVKSALWSDAPVFDAQNVEAGHEYTGLSLAGDPDIEAPYDDQHALMHTIYSYEQYAATMANPDPATVPSVVVTYARTDDPTRTFTHNVTLQDAAGNAIPLQRNHLYRVNVIQQDSELNFTITVREWTEGETFDVSFQAVRDGAARTEARVGDFFTQEGLIVRAEDAATWNAAHANNPIIGIVFCANSDPSCEQFLQRHYDALPDDAKATLGRTTHGLVMSLKNIYNGQKVYFAPEGSSYYTSNPVADPQAAKSVITGLKNSREIDAKSTTNSTSAYIALRYTPVPTTEAYTTGWYLPSVAELIEMGERLGFAKPDGTNALTAQQISDWKIGTYGANQNAAQKFATNLTAWLSRAGSGNYTSVTTGTYFWSSVEQNTGEAYALSIDTSTAGDDSYIHRLLPSYDRVRSANGSCYARAVLAF